MSTPKPQSFRSHASFDPMFHGVAGVAVLGNIIFMAIVLFVGIQSRVVLSIWILTLTVVLVVTLLKARMYPLKIQDRIIRLEERLRLDALLTENLRKRIPELTEDQLIGLRFASDDEIPELVHLTLEKNLDRKQIKERIQSWRPDHYRI
jgi:cell division protein FtsL